jgi:hypothetical protein
LQYKILRTKEDIFLPHFSLRHPKYIYGRINKKEWGGYMKNKLYEQLIRKVEREADGFFYTYELTCREADEVAAFRLPLYSIHISLCDSEGYHRQSTAKDIFSNLAKAESFFDKIVRNLATPIDLMYVLEDEIG